jgi:hypothetical protein
LSEEAIYLGKRCGGVEPGEER